MDQCAEVTSTMIPVPSDVDMVVAESSEGENREQPMDHSGSAGGASAAAAVHHPQPPSAVTSDAATTAGPAEQSTRQDPTAVGGQQASKKPQERLEVLPPLLTKATICR